MTTGAGRAGETAWPASKPWAMWAGDWTSMHATSVHMYNHSLSATDCKKACRLCGQAGHQQGMSV